MTRLKSKTNLNHKKTFTSYVEIKNIISQILFGEDLSNILDVILLHLEDKLPKARASILLFDKKNNCLRNIAAPSLPESFCQLIDGIKIGPKVGSCGTAAYFKSTTVVRDTFSDPLWATYLEAAKTFNLRSCWSVPILNMKGELLGTLALYYGTPHKPTQAESILVKELLVLICLAIERDRSAMLKKESEEEIQNQRTNALNSLKCASLGEMAKNISHEINGPLAVILGSVHQMNRIMDQESTNTEKLKIYTARLDRSVIRIEKIVKGLHSITRETSDDPFIHVQINSVIDEALSFFHERFLSHNIKINLSGDLEAIFECRNTQITQVLVSLLNNSFEAIVGSENPWIQVDTALFGNNIRIEITDSGPGISSEIAEKIMIPLFTTKVLAKATGLGLSISQAFVEEHSGKIWYDQKCQHTRFVIELPIEQMPSLKQVA